MKPEHLERLCEDFNLGLNPVAEENHEGVLNKNYILTTDTGKYFVKSIRDKKRPSLPYIAQVEEFMFGQGIPAICMLADIRGQKTVQYDTDVYTVYPYLESDRTHCYDNKDFEAMGVMLGRIHKAGSRDVPSLLAAKVFGEKEINHVLEKLQAYREQIPIEGDYIDDVFREYIDLKLKMLPLVLDTPSLPMSTLVHGDYHSRNLLINKKREIIGVCDWEQTSMNARAYELARSILYVCFNGESEEEPHLYENEIAIESARSFISGYSSIYPISNEEVRQGLMLRLKKLVCSIWIEEQFYVNGDARSNKFIPHEMRLIRDFSDDLLYRAIVL